MQHPAVVLAFERQVLTASLPIAAVVQSLGIAAMTDEGDVPYYLAAILCGLYAFMGRPLVSSFHQARPQRSIGGAGAPPPRDATVQVGRQAHVRRGAGPIEKQQRSAIFVASQRCDSTTLALNNCVRTQ
jgi:hypothetical protein